VHRGWSITWLASTKSAAARASGVSSREKKEGGRSLPDVGGGTEAGPSGPGPDGPPQAASPTRQEDAMISSRMAPFLSSTALSDHAPAAQGSCNTRSRKVRFHI